MDDVAREFLRDVSARFDQWKQTAEKAVAQLDDQQLHWKPDPESNSAAIILWHIAGNLRSRWRGFMVSDGEKPDRHRDTEFEIGPDTSRDEIMAWWNGAWELQQAELARVRPEDLLRTVTTRRRPESVIEAIDRQLCHLASHVGQVVYIAKHVSGERWQTLSIERGKSREFNEKMGRHLAATPPNPPERCL
jgi:hypothetical protein